MYPNGAEAISSVHDELSETDKPTVDSSGEIVITERPSKNSRKRLVPLVDVDSVSLVDVEAIMEPNMPFIHPVHDFCLSSLIIVCLASAYVGCRVQCYLHALYRFDPDASYL